jgi:hypothetical protein
MLKPPIRGIADQGDFERMMTWIGVTYQSNDYDVKYFHWVNRFFNLGEMKVGDVVSSEIIFLFIARFINLFINRTTFDLNILGIVQTFFFSAVLSLNFYYLKKINTFLGFLFIPFALFVFTDIGYTAYFNSFYQESSGLIFLFLTLAIILKSIYEIGSKKDHTNLILLTISSVLLISAKSQYFILFIPVVFSLYMLFRTSISTKTLRTIGFFLMVFSFVYYFLGTPNIIKRWNVYNSIFPQILSSSSDPERAMKILKLDSKFLKYSGIAAFMPNNGVDDPDLEKSLTPAAFPRIILYYVVTPKELITLSKDIAKRSFTTIVYYLGYYEKSSGHPSDENPVNFNLWSRFKSHKLEKLYIVLLPFLIFILIATVIVNLLTNNIHSIPIFFVVSSALCQFLVITFSQGVCGGVEKFLFLFDICFDISLFVLGSAIYMYVAKLIHTRKLRQ